jgi:hypothetical protein
LLVALIPGLLMMATFALERLETGLSRDTVSAADVATFLDQAEADDVNTLARDGMSCALAGQHRRLHAQGPAQNGHVRSPDTARLPTRELVHSAANPEFQRTSQPDRV